MVLFLTELNLTSARKVGESYWTTFADIIEGKHSSFRKLWWRFVCNSCLFRQTILYWFLGEYKKQFCETGPAQILPMLI